LRIQPLLKVKAFLSGRSGTCKQGRDGHQALHFRGVDASDTTAFVRGVRCVSSVLFVCLGNICRSPLAEGMMRHLATQAGHDLHIESAGTGDWHIGSPPDERAMAAAVRGGFDISGQRARQICRDDFGKFAHIAVMDGANLIAVQNLRPSDVAVQPKLLLDFAKGQSGKSVPDPYYGNKRDFDETVRLVKLGCTGLLAQISG
jgi:protein-tyrosine phosphatase